jgi:hypothetical protein
LRRYIKVQADELRRVLTWAIKRKFDKGKGGGAGGRGAEVPDGEEDEEEAAAAAAAEEAAVDLGRGVVENKP